jgi:hypothetical protein
VQPSPPRAYIAQQNLLILKCLIYDLGDTNIVLCCPISVSDPFSALVAPGSFDQLRRLQGCSENRRLYQEIIIYIEIIMCIDNSWYSLVV